MSLRIGFIGFGEVGSAFARGFRDVDRACTVLAYDPAAHCGATADLVKSRAAAGDVELCPTAAEVAERSEIIFCAVPAVHAMDAARSVRNALRAQHGYCDLSAGRPEAKRAVAELVMSAGAAFADLAIVGPVSVLGHRVPIIASGELREAHAAALRTLGMEIEGLSSRPGDASALKLCRSVFTKGLEALLVETMLAARRLDIDQRVLASLDHTLSQQSFTETANRYITSDAVHAVRRAHELEDAIRLLESIGVRPLVTGGSLARLRNAVASGASERFGGAPPGHYEEVIDFYSTVEGTAETPGPAVGADQQSVGEGM